MPICSLHAPCPKRVATNELHKHIVTNGCCAPATYSSTDCSLFLFICTYAWQRILPCFCVVFLENCEQEQIVALRSDRSPEWIKLPQNDFVFVCHGLFFAGRGAM
ncbi:unnamed protein product [Musa textilis]